MGALAFGSSGLAIAGGFLFRDRARHGAGRRRRVVGGLLVASSRQWHVVLEAVAALHFEAVDPRLLAALAAQTCEEGLQVARRLDDPVCPQAERRGDRMPRSLQLLRLLEEAVDAQLLLLLRLLLLRLLLLLMLLLLLLRLLLLLLLLL